MSGRGRGKGRKGKGSKAKEAVETPPKSKSKSTNLGDGGEESPSSSVGGAAADGENPSTTTPPEETPEEAKVEEEAEVFLTAVTPNDITDESCKTFIFKNEGHTLGNALRFVISHYPEVTFCGHTIPHPSENEMHLRIQTAAGTSAVDSLRKGLQDLVVLCEHTETVFDDAMSKWSKEHPDTNTFQVPAPPGPPRH